MLKKTRIGDEAGFSSDECAAPYCAAADAGMLAPFFARGLRGFFLCSVIGGE
jgi:hypothetical protein